MGNSKNDNNQIKRKRRSFWEPESQVLTDFLNKQKNMGVSIQVMIIDAMAKYGDVDIVEAYLGEQALIVGDVDTKHLVKELEPPQAKLKRHNEIDKDKVVENEVVKIKAKETVNDDIIETVEVTSENTIDNSNTMDMINNVKDVEVKEPVVVTDVQEKQVDMTITDMEDDYDPVDILLRDAGSVLNK